MTQYEHSLIERLVASLDAVLLHQGKYMPAQDQDTRRALVTEAEKYLEKLTA